MKDMDGYKDALAEVSEQLDTAFPKDIPIKKKRVWWKTLLKVLMWIVIVLIVLATGLYFGIEWAFSNWWH